MKFFREDGWTVKTPAFNPYLPSYEYVPDGEPRVFGDRLYVYGSHDRFGGKDFCLNDYVCWSAPLEDLGDWRYEGVIYRATQDPKNAKGNQHMNAPDCIQGPDGRYYLYYQLHVLKCSSVAVADTPVGPFEFYGYVQHPDGVPYGDKKGDTFAFDPGVLVDDDGKVYLYVGFTPKGMFKMVFTLRGNQADESVCLRLDSDMKTVLAQTPMIPGPDKAVGTDFAGHGFFEASSIRKIGDTYYFVYSSELSHELCYATSKHPDRDFRYGGTLVSIADIGYKGNILPQNYTGNTHGGMVQIGEQWYIFYHRQTNRVKCARQGCAEKILIRPDGSIDQVEITSCGLNDGPLPGVGTYEARIACKLRGPVPMVKSDFAMKEDKKGLLPYFTQTGEDREDHPDQYIANLCSGSEAGFKYFDLKRPEKLRVTVRGAEGKIGVLTERGGETLAVIPVSDAADWTEFSAPTLRVAEGKCALFFRYMGRGAIDFKDFTIE